MLQVAVVDRTADSRRQLIERLSEYLKPGTAEIEYLPRIHLIPLSVEELRFRALPDICIVGASLVRGAITELSNVRERLPGVVLLAEVCDQSTGIGIIEQLARYGVDDFFSAKTSGQEFLRKIVLLSRRIKLDRSGTLVLVDSGKGGVGVTSIAAGLAECLVEAEQKVALVDLDFESQDASRFLQSRPYINENLQAICVGQRPATCECVAECLTAVWTDETRYMLLSPPPESDALYDTKGSFARSFVGVMEVLDGTFDVIVIDLGNAAGAVRRALYRAADALVYVVNNDAATAYASVSRLQRMRALLPADAGITIIDNASQKHGLPSAVLRREIIRATRVQEGAWLEGGMPFCRIGMKWPGSGGTLYSQASREVRKAFKQLACTAGLLESHERQPQWRQKLWALSRKSPAAPGAAQAGREPEKQISYTRPELSVPAVADGFISPPVIL